MIYQPAEDSLLLEKFVKKYSKGKKVLDMGSGSGIQALAALNFGAREVLAVDIDIEAVKSLKKKRLNVLRSDLFENVIGRFDLIIFNPPYLPFDLRENSESALATSGGEKGDEIIVRFLSKASDFLTENGRILLVVSSLTPLDRINKIIRRNVFKKRVLAREKFFMEELGVWKLFP